MWTKFKRRYDAIDNWLDTKAIALFHKHKSILIILGIAIYLRLLVWQIPKEIWHDEAFQYLYSLKPVSFIIAGTDVHPPLYNLFAKLLISIIGNDILMLRLVGAMTFSVLFLFVLYYCIRDIFGERTAFWSALLLAVTPTYLYYSVEFRNYSWTFFFLILQIWIFNKLTGQNLENNRFTNLRLPAILYVFLSTVVLYSHYFTSLIILTQFLYVLYLRWRKEIPQILLKLHIVTLLIITVLCIPLLLYSFSMLSQIGSMWYRGVTLVSLLSTFCYIVTPPLTTPVGVVLFIYGLAIYGLVRWRKEINSSHVQFIMYLLVPILLMWVLGITKLLVLYHPRYFLFGGIGVFVLAAWSLARLGEIEVEWDVCFFGFYCLLVFFAFGHGFSHAFQTDILKTATFLQQRTENISGCMTDCTFIHSTQGTQSPYRVYFPNTKQYLISNLTKKQEFTRGGSVILWDYVRRNISDVPVTRYMYYITETPLIDKKTIYTGDGIYVQEIN